LYEQQIEFLSLYGCCITLNTDSSSYIALHCHSICFSSKHFQTWHEIYGKL